MLRLFSNKDDQHDNAELASADSRDRNDAEMIVIGSEPVPDRVEASGSESFGWKKRIAATFGRIRMTSTFGKICKTMRAMISCVPQPSDTTHDNVRSRLMVMATSLLLFTFLAFAVFAPPMNSEPSGTRLFSTTTLPQNFRRTFFDSTDRSPSFLILSNDVPKSEPMTVCVDLNQYTLVSSPNSRNLQCDSDAVNIFQNSLRGISNQRPCEVAISGRCSTSNSTGLVTFSALDFGSSPTGTYSLVFIARDDPKVFSSRFTTTIPPFDGTIRLESATPQSITPLQRILPAPTFRVERARGIPAPAGIQLRAFVWDGFSSPLGNRLNTNVDEYSFGELRGDVAATDANGMATFFDLQLVGSSSSSVFINVTIGNVVFASLSILVPIPVVSQVASVSILNPQSFVEVEEGIQFPFPLQVKLQCSLASFCINRRVYASLDYISGNHVRQVQFRSFFSPRFPQPKILYNTTATTDSNGLAVFSALQFSVHGRAGDFKISFVSDGVYSASQLSGTFRETGIPNVLNPDTSYIAYRDLCGHTPRSPRVIWNYASQLKTHTNIISNVANSLTVFLAFSPQIFAMRRVGRKPAKIELLSAILGSDFQVNNAEIPFVTEDDGSLRANVTFFPFSNGRLVNRSTASIFVSFDDVSNPIKFEIPFLFIFSSSVPRCTFLPSTPIPSLCPSGGFISVFTGSYQSSDMKIWTPWFPGHWSSTRPFSLNFTLNSNPGFRPSFVCNSTDYPTLLVH
jgi:hypothetical protein